jgi:hypothetical protein
LASTQGSSTVAADDCSRLTVAPCAQLAAVQLVTVHGLNQVKAMRIAHSACLGTATPRYSFDLQ